MTAVWRKCWNVKASLKERMYERNVQNKQASGYIESGQACLRLANGNFFYRKVSFPNESLKAI